MTAPVSAVVVYTLRSCIGTRRWLGCALLGAAAVLLGLLAHAIDEPAARAFARVAADGIFTLVVPIVSLVIGDAVLGAEIRTGVFHFTWLSPTSPAVIAAGRWLGGTVAAAAVLAPACAVAALVAGAPSDAGAVALAAVTGAAAYIGVFVAIGTVTRRTAVWSLAYVFLVERLLGAALSGIAQWSPTWVSRAVFVDLAADAPASLERSGIPAGAGAVVRLAVIAVLGLVIAWVRLPRIRLAGAAD